MLRVHALSAVIAIAIVNPLPAQSPSPLRKNLLGQSPPELISHEKNWLHGAPTSLKDLHGRVVWLQFNF